MKGIGIIGYGNLGQQFEHLISSTEKNLEYHYFDDLASTDGRPNAYPFEAWEDEQFSELEFLIGLGYQHPAKKLEILSRLSQLGRRMYTYIHPLAFVDPTARIGEGTVVYPHNLIDMNAATGKSCVLRPSSTIEHDTVVGDCCYLSQSVGLAGRVSIGDGVFMGVRSCVSNRVSIGDLAVVGIGTVITKDVPRKAHVIGNPQRTVSGLKLL